MDESTAIPRMLCDLTNSLARLIGERAVEDLDDEDYRKAVETIQTMSECLDWIGSVSSLLDRCLGSSEPVPRTLAASVLCRTAGAATDRLLPVLAGALGADDVYCRRAAAKAIGDLGPAAADLLPQALRDDDWQVRHYALQSALRLGLHSSGAVRELIDILRQSSEPDDAGIPQVWFRMDACDALREIGPAAHEAVPHLQVCVAETGTDEETTLLRLRAAHALWHITGDANVAVPVAVALLGHDEFWLSVWACEVLADIGREAAEVVSHLRHAGSSECEALRHAAAKALQAISR